MRQITTYDKNDVITIDYAKSQKPFYTYNGKTVSIIEGLSPIHFAEKLYSGVEEGSKRWWVLERRKHDYNKFHSRRNVKRVTKDVINNHELEWTEKVANFYTLLHRGYLVKEVIKADGKIPSAYIIKKHFDGDNILSDEQAKKIGYDKNGRPLFFTVYRDAEGNDVDVECNVDLENIKYSGGNDCRRESLHWWIIERMSFDEQGRHWSEMARVDLNEYRHDPKYRNELDYGNHFFKLIDTIGVDNTIAYYERVKTPRSEFDNFLNERGYKNHNYLKEIIGTQCLRNMRYADAVR